MGGYQVIYKLAFAGPLFFLAGMLNIQAQGRLDVGRFKLAVGAGYRQDNLQWSIAQTGGSPNILSELIWKDLRGPAVDASFSWHALKRFYFYIDFSRSFVLAGRATDTDYKSDNRTDIDFSKSLDGGRGGSIAASAGIGYDLLRNDRFYLIPQAGYGFRSQSLYLLESGEELNGIYKTQWCGPYISLEPGIFLTERLSADALLTYRYMHYTAKAGWPQRPEFEQPVSFRHRANGEGLEARLRLSMQVNPVVSLYLAGNYFYFQTAVGIDELYETTGGRPRARLNGVTTKGGSISIGAAVRF